MLFIIKMFVKIREENITMLTFLIVCPGLGVAMENAIDDVKNIAQFITKDCDEDGIAGFIC